MTESLVCLDRLPVDAPWSDTRKEPKMPVCFQLLVGNQISCECLDMLEDMGIGEPLAVLVVPPFYFQFIEGLPQPCLKLEEVLPLQPWYLAMESGTTPSESNIMVFSIVLPEVY